MLADAVALLQTHEPAFATRFDRVISVQIDATDPLLAGHGRAERVEYAVEFSGTLHVWTKVAGETDLFLRVEEERGNLAGEDDDSGGGKTPYVKLEVEPGTKLWIWAAQSKEPSRDSEIEASLQLELHLVAAPETEATRGAAERAKGELVEVKRLREVKDLAAARGSAVNSLDDLLGLEGAEASELVAARAWELGWEASRLSNLKTAERAWGRAWSHRSRTLPVDHPDLQAARLNLAVTVRNLGHLAGARALEERALEVGLRTLPDDHPDLQLARQGLGGTLYVLGDLAGARALFEKVLEVFSRTLPDDHPDLQRARGNVALTITALGDLAGARALEEKALEVFSRMLPDDHPDLQKVRLNLAGTNYVLGDLAGARALFEKVLEINSRTLPDDHLDLQKARLNLALIMKNLGDLAGARALEEKVLEVSSRTLPDDHPDLQRVRLNLVGTIKSLGDFAGARALGEKVLEVSSRTLPDDHPDLQEARLNHAATIKAFGDPAGARALVEKVLEVRSRTLPEDHPDLQEVRNNLATTIHALDDFAAARAIFEQVLEVRSRTLPDEHPDLQRARKNLAIALANQYAQSRVAPVGEGENRAEREGARERCAQLMQTLCRAQVRAARASLLSGSSREAEERCARLAGTLDLSLAFAAGYGVFDPITELERESFVLSETTRGAALSSADLMRSSTNAPRYGELCSSLRQASDELVGLAQKGTTSDEFQRALRRREEVERELVALSRELPGGTPGALEFDLEALATQLGDRDVVVGLRRYKRWSVEVGEELDSTGGRKVREKSVDSLCALVLRRSMLRSPAPGVPGSGDAPLPTASVIRVELGPIDPIDAAVRAWRNAIGAEAERGEGVAGILRDAARARGEELRRLAFDPLLPALEGADHVFIALDDVLHLVPLDALPSDGDASAAPRLVGERWRIETRATLAELLSPRAAGTGAGPLVAVGGASFNSEPMGPNDADLAAIEASAPTTEESGKPQNQASILRGGAWERGFPPLTYTGLEAREIGALFDEVFDNSAAVVVLEKRKASRAALEELAPRARWLHVATHGWFAPESIPSWSDVRALDEKSGLGMRMSGEEQVKGMSPMLLCGLALAGANLPENALGRVPGLVTAEELSTLDLRNCEMVVLSACDTNVGERRAGQGVASLQRALQMAGARSVITSLWKVPDEATRELMLDFYRRLWVEKKPKHQALWEAKMKLRNAKDELGLPRYTQRDWAAWVLTGEPD